MSHKYCTGYGMPHLRPAVGYLSCPNCRWNPNPVTVASKPKALIIKYERGTILFADGAQYSDTHDILGKLVSVSKG